eukprot:scaffold28915_cov29-Tisochrysis_lutea.AAC.6
MSAGPLPSATSLEAEGEGSMAPLPAHSEAKQGRLSRATSSTEAMLYEITGGAAQAEQWRAQWSDTLVATRESRANDERQRRVASKGLERDCELTPSAMGCDGGRSSGPKSTTAACFTSNEAQPKAGCTNSAGTPRPIHRLRSQVSSRM